MYVYTHKMKKGFLALAVDKYGATVRCRAMQDETTRADRARRCYSSETQQLGWTVQ